MAIRGHRGTTWRDLFWICSGCWLGVVLNQLAGYVWKYALHKWLSAEQEVILFSVCIILCVTGACIISMVCAKQSKNAAADRKVGYEAKPHRQLLREILLYLFLNVGAGILMFFLLRREDLHRLQN